MRYWWVNQNQTFKQEVNGGYLWSPKHNTNGGTNPFYEFMREVSPGDLIFSFEGTYIRAIGVANSFAYESPKPPEFGNTGPNWNLIGWRVDVKFNLLENQIRPADHMKILRSVLPPIYSPLQSNGRGNQGVYLTKVHPFFADQLIHLIGEEVRLLNTSINQVADTNVPIKDTAVGLVEWEEHLINNIQNDTALSDTERSSIILARRGQGYFKERVMQFENKCRITKVNRIEHLRASHIKPWRDCESAEERLSGNNGLLLTPSIDHLFDRGFISFENNGALIISPIADDSSLSKMGVQTQTEFHTGHFNDEQKYYLDYHRKKVFLQAKVNR